MSGEALYERYKDALKRGHVASLRGRLEEALAAYAEAATIAPERSTPHTSAGTALLRRKRPGDAVRHYEAALRLAPREEAALLGRAQALAALDRRPEAADAFDALAEARALTGKLADAVDAARRGLELAEGRDRRRTLERLIERLRASEPGEPGRLALERALRVLEGPAVQVHPQAPIAEASPAIAPAVPIDDAAWPVAELGEAAAALLRPASDPEPAADAEPETEPEAVVAEPVAEPMAEPEPQAAPAEPEAAEAEAAGDGAQAPDDTAPAADAPIAEEEGPAAWSPEIDPGAPPIRAALDRDLPPSLDSGVLGRTVEEAIARGETPTLDRLLDLAAALRRDGRIDGALDACYLALSLAPDDVGLHLALVQLYDERGWTTLASEKLDLLGRLVVLDEDDTGAARLAAARTARS